VSEIENILERTAVRKTDTLDCGGANNGNSIPNNIYGWGRIDAKAAVTEALRYSGVAIAIESDITLRYISNTKMVIDSKNFKTPYDLNIFNAQGQLIDTWKINSNFSFQNIAKYAAGVYFIQCNKVKLNNCSFIKS
jgi:hypothetical protein